MRIPSSVLKQAEQSHGLVCLSDLDRADVSRDTEKRLVRAGLLVPVHEAVYRVAGAPESWKQRELAACLATGGVASHRAALPLWDIDLDIDVPVELSVTRPHAPRPDGAVVHRSRDLDPEMAAWRDGIPVTTPLRMLLDLGAVVNAYWVSRAVEKCVVEKLLTVKAARAELDRLARKGRRGAGVLRRVLDDWPVGEVRPDSVLEVRFARLCKRANLPKPVFQFDLIVGGRRRRLDFAYPSSRLAIEVDGFATRTDRRVFQEDRRRQNDLIAAGWRVLRFTWHDVLHRPEYVAATISSLLGKERHG
jgi:very-short-patch-repair endonuclease